jgi:hypothetical protein
VVRTAQQEFDAKVFLERDNVFAEQGCRDAKFFRGILIAEAL